VAYPVKTSLAFAIGLVALGCGGAAEQPAIAQTTPTTPQASIATVQPTPAVPTPPPSGVSDSEVKAFANTVIALAMLEEQGTARVQAGEPVEQVEADLEQQMGQVFAQNPITPERFGEIADQLDTDPALRNRIRSQLQQSMASAAV
jgi:hypothetical protein